MLGGGAAAVALAGGGWLVWTQVLDGGGPEATVRNFVDALDRGDAQAANRYVHPDSPLNGVSQSTLDQYGDVELTVRSLTVLSQTETRATVRVTVYSSVVDRENTLTYDLRRLEGEWLLYSRGSDETPSVETPQVSFDFDYDGFTSRSMGVLTITHAGGDTVEAGALYVRGTGFAEGRIDDAETDLNSPGSWSDSDGDATQQYASDSEITAGYRIAVGVTSDYHIAVVWEAPDGETSATLAEDMGPDS